MSLIPFAKVESIGNDFVLVESANLADVSEDALRQLAIRLCQRRFGIGSDGLLVLSRDPGVVMRMFNPDGTEDFCGNGLRCAAVYAHSKGWVGAEFGITHGGLSVPTEVAADGLVATVIGPASFKPQDVPLDECSGELFQATLDLEDATLTVSSLTTGSTHTVIFCDELPRDREFVRISRELEHHQLFPMRTSVIWAKEEGLETPPPFQTPTLPPSHPSTHPPVHPSTLPTLQASNPPPVHPSLRIRIWERGVGETQGCGTGSAAAAAALMRRLGKGCAVRVINPGGTVIVSAAQWDAPLKVEGRAGISFTGTYDLAGD